MKYSVFACVVALAGCQSVPQVQSPILLAQTPAIVVRHAGGVQDGACPMWVRVDGVLKGEIENGKSLVIEAEPGLRTVSLGRSKAGVFGAGVFCTGSLQSEALVTRAVEVGTRPIKLIYDMEGTGKRWIPVAGLFLAPTPVLNSEPDA